MPTQSKNIGEEPAAKMRTQKLAQPSVKRGAPKMRDMRRRAHEVTNRPGTPQDRARPTRVESAERGAYSLGNLAASENRAAREPKRSNRVRNEDTTLNRRELTDKATAVLKVSQSESGSWSFGVPAQYKVNAQIRYARRESNHG